MQTLINTICVLDLHNDDNSKHSWNWNVINVDSHYSNGETEYSLSEELILYSPASGATFMPIGAGAAIYSNHYFQICVIIVATTFDFFWK